MHPISQIEFSNYKNTREKLQERLLFGDYPESIHINNWSDKQKYLIKIRRKADKIYNLLR
jgi:hypothetical protein